LLSLVNGKRNTKVRQVFIDRFVDAAAVTTVKGCRWYERHEDGLSEIGCQQLMASRCRLSQSAVMDRQLI